MQCRACLNENCGDTTRLDETKILSFNLITNLTIHEADSMPQQLCQNCTKDLKYCVEFREKCITSNAVLLSAKTKKEVLKITAQIKEEEDTNELKHTINIKKYDIEVNTKEERDPKNEFHETHSSDDNFEYEFISDNNGSAKTSLSKRNTGKPKEKAKVTKKCRKRGGKYDCGLCAEQVEKTKLSEHVEGHKKDSHCGICSLHLEGWEAMVQHRVSHLTDPNLLCHNCLRHHSHQLSLKCHYITKHSVKTEHTFKCSYCDRSLSNASNLYKHVRAMHTNKTFACKQCPKVYSTARILKNHEYKVHEKNKKCEECDFTTSSLHSLRQHVLRAHAAGAVACARCRTLFADARRLARHDCGTSTSTVCPVCGVTCPAPDKLREHLASHSSERRYKCSRCDAAYRSWRSLRVHVSKHDGVRQHRCEFCPAAFWGRPTLVKHRRLHTGERPYVCKLCDKGFTANHNLKLHMRVHGVYDLIKKKTTPAADPASDGKQTSKISPSDSSKTP